MTTCLKAQSEIGHTVYHNICTGVQEIVPWGAADWVLAGFMGFCAVILVGFLLFAIACMLDMFKMMLG